MFNKVLLTLIITSVLFAASKPTSEGEKYYFDLIEYMKGNGTKGLTADDFYRFRKAFVLVRKNNKNMKIDSALDRKLEKAFKKNNEEEIIAGLNEILDRDYTQIKAHILLSHFYGKMENDSRAHFHNDIARNLIASILSSGEGKQERPFVIFEDDEIEEVLKLLSLFKSGDEKEIEKDAQKLLQVECTNAKSSEFSVYFDVSEYR